MLGLAAGLWAVLAQDGIDGLDLALLACGLATLPWTVLGFWNAAIGFLLVRAGRRGVLAAAPQRGRGGGGAAPRHHRRGDDAAQRGSGRALSRLALVRESLERTGQGAASATTC